MATLGLVGTSASSDVEAVATVAIKDGNIEITSVAAGKATITVTDGTNNATIEVTVAADGSITIDKVNKYTVTFPSKTDSSTVNDVATLGLVGTGASSSAEAVATAAINGGKVEITSVGAGTATITVTDNDGREATIAVTVNADGSITLGTITKYENQSDSNIPWVADDQHAVSDDPTVATVGGFTRGEAGKVTVTAVKPGTTKVTVTHADGGYTYFEVTVSKTGAIRVSK